MKSNREQAKQAFGKDTANHQMTVLLENDVYRHLRFRKADCSSYWFDIVTWPGMLTINGDMGTYSFSRLPDMFEFFRTDADRGDGINPGYWAEKLQSMCTFGGLKHFQEEKFNRAVMSDVVEWIRRNRDRTSKDERRELWNSVVSEVIDLDDDESGSRRKTAAYDFHHRVNAGLSFEFIDFWEHNLTDYSFHFYWCLYAIAWAVKQYDQSKLEAKGQQEEVGA